MFPEHICLPWSLLHIKMHIRACTLIFFLFAGIQTRANLDDTSFKKEKLSAAGYLKQFSENAVSDSVKAAGYLEKLLFIQNKIDNSAYSVKIQDTILSILGKTILEEYYYSKIRSIVEHKNMENIIPFWCLTIGNFYFYKGNYSKCYTYYNKAITSDKTGKYTPKAKANIGAIYVSFHDYRNALKYYQEIYSIIKDNKSEKKFKAVVLGNIGKCYYGMGKFEEAKKVFISSINIRNSVHDSVLITRDYLDLGLVYDTLNNDKEALKWFSWAIKSDSSHKMYYQLASAYGVLSNFYEKRKLYEKALAYSAKAWKLIDTNKYSDLLAASNVLSFARLNEMAGNSKMAIFMYKKYFSMRDSLYNGDIANKIAEYQVRYDTKSRENELMAAQLKMNEKDIRNQRVIIISAISLTVFLILVLGIIWYFQRKRHRMENQLEFFKQKALQQLMNPHFLFNALNSIQYFILKNDTVTSHKYLTKLARLVRTFLNLSQFDFIAVEKEIETITLYLELESLRFDKKFVFSIQVEDEIDVVNDKIPVLLIQPFVENAILHGVLNRKEGKGIISVQFIQQKNHICCIVEDNGVGREESGNIYKTNKPDHKSMGTSITLKRLDLLKKLHKLEATFEYTDLKDDHNRAVGTRVRILIPKFN